MANSENSTLSKQAHNRCTYETCFTRIYGVPILRLLQNHMHVHYTCTCNTHVYTDIRPCFISVTLKPRPIPQSTSARTTSLYEPHCCSSQAAQNRPGQSVKASELLPARRSECLSCLQHTQRKCLPHQAAAGMRVQHPKSSLLQTLPKGTGCPLGATMPAEETTISQLPQQRACSVTSFVRLTKTDYQILTGVLLPWLPMLCCRRLTAPE